MKMIYYSEAILNYEINNIDPREIYFSNIENIIDNDIYEVKIKMDVTDYKYPTFWLRNNINSTLEDNYINFVDVEGKVIHEYRNVLNSNDNEWHQVLLKIDNITGDNEIIFSNSFYIGIIDRDIRFEIKDICFYYCKKIFLQ